MRSMTYCVISTNWQRSTESPDRCSVSLVIHATATIVQSVSTFISRLLGTLTWLAWLAPKESEACTKGNNPYAQGKLPRKPRTKLEVWVTYLCDWVFAIDVTEYQWAKQYLIQRTKRKIYKEELKSLKLDIPIHKVSQITKLSLIFDRHGIIYMRGHIAAASMTYEQRHPIISSVNAILRHLIINEAYR